MRASIARLRALLASASPEFRARVLRLIRREIHRLEHGGLSRRERSAARRLRRLLHSLDKHALPSTAQTPVSIGRLEGAGIDSARAGAILAAGASHSRSAYVPRTSGRDRGRLPFLPPVSPSSPFYWFVLAFLAGIGFALLLLSLSSRKPLPLPMRGIVAVRPLELRALALTIALAGALGISVVLLLG